MNNDNEIQEDVQPIMDLFTGTDGGTGFAKFRHSFLPEIYSQNTEQAKEFRLMMKRMSKLAKIMMNKA